MNKNKSIINYWIAFFIALLIHSWIFFFSVNSTTSEQEIDHLVNVQLLNEENLDEPTPPKAASPPPVQTKIINKEIPREPNPEPESIAEEEILTKKEKVSNPPIETTSQQVAKPSASVAPIGTQTVESQNLDNSDFKPFGNKKPDYPALARRSGIEGWVSVKVLVNEKGKVIKAMVIDYSGHSSFKESTLAVANSWRFPAPIANGKRVQTWYLKKVAFVLRD